MLMPAMHEHMLPSLSLCYVTLGDTFCHAGDEQLRWTSGSGLHRTDELGSTDTAVLAVEGSLGRVCAADAHKLGLAAAQLAAAGVSEVLLAVTNCPPTLR